MTGLFAIVVGAIAGALGHLVGKGGGMGLMSIVLVALGVFIGWTVVGVIGGRA